MALDSYSGLKTGIADFIARADTTAMVDYAIDLCEAWMNRKLRTHEMETTNGSLTVSSGVITHPADFLQWKQIGVTSNGVRLQLEPLALEQRSFYDDGTSDLPGWYSVRGGSTLLVPSPDATYTYDGTYYQKIPALSDTNTVNWVITNHPDLYLYGSLAQTEAFFTDDARIAGWKSFAEQAMNEVLEANAKKDFGQVPSMRVRGPVY